jgi:RNA polymerase primary sigma factor
MERHNERYQLTTEVDEVLRRLTPREEQLLRMRFGIGQEAHDPVEVGRRFGIDGLRLQRVESWALRKLRLASLVEDGAR